jgi:WD40 repeat protein
VVMRRVMIQIWSSFHCVLHANLKMGASVYSMRISFDGRTLVATLKDRSLRIYDLSDAEAVRKGKPKKVFACSKHWTWGTPDGLPPPGALVFAGQDRPQQEQRTTYVEEGKGEVTMWACDISPDGTRVVTSGDDTRLKIWDTSKIIGFKRMSSNGG